MDGTRLLNAWVLGGDGRYPWAVKALGESGLPVRTWGVRDCADGADSLEAALEGADLALLPMRPFQGERLKIGKESVEAALLPWLLAENATLIYGQMPGELENWLQSRGIRCVSVLELESYQMTNAMITAEGAVYLALRELNRTLSGADALVIGWGRIGKFLAEKLKGMDAHVTVAARREGDWAEIEAHDLRVEETGRYHQGLKHYDLILNTVPAAVMDAGQAARIREDCVLIELASLPGGFPAEIQDRRTLVMAQGLPGVTAPRSAGEALAAGVWACLTGEGRTLE